MSENKEIEKLTGYHREAAKMACLLYTSPDEPFQLPVRRCTGKGGHRLPPENGQKKSAGLSSDACTVKLNAGHCLSLIHI